MQFSLDSLAAIATIIGTVLTVLALVQAREWLIFTALAMIGVAVAAGLYARHQRHALKSAAITIEGRSIDALNLANLRRTVNRSLFIQEAHHTASFEGDELKLEWMYAGYCRAKRESAMAFSVESEERIPFDQLDCFAYDLVNDPARAHPIRPLLIGADGVSKKISVPFAAPLKFGDRFHLMLRCTFAAGAKQGVGYYTSTLSFAQPTIRRCIVRIVFAGTPPRWLRVYECAGRGPPTLLRALTPVRYEYGETEYRDEAENVPGRSARVYAFGRPS